MLKRDKNFKLPKYVKTQMAFMRNPQARSDYKNAMIEAIIKSSIPVKSKKQQKETTTDEE
jgi:hypothetical protein